MYRGEIRFGYQVSTSVKFKKRTAPHLQRTLQLLPRLLTASYLYAVYKQNSTMAENKPTQITEQQLHKMINEAVKRLLSEAYNPLEKIQALIDQANQAYEQAKETQGGDQWPLMDKDGTPYGLSSPIKLDGRGYVIIPFNGTTYSEYSSPERIRVITKQGGKIRIIQGDYMEEGWKDVARKLKQIVKDAQIGIANFQNYDPSWETPETMDDYKASKEALRQHNKMSGRRANTGMDYIQKP